MEARVIKLIDCIEANKSEELSQIAAFQLGQLAKENSSVILEKLHQIFFNQNIEVRLSAGLALSEVLSNITVFCKAPESPLKFETFQKSMQSPSKKQKTEENSFCNLLNSFRSLILCGN